MVLISASILALVVLVALTLALLLRRFFDVISSGLLLLVTVLAMLFRLAPW
jgi:hypothetical protein